MADTKISALPAASTPLTGSEVVPLNQSGVTSNVTVANLTAGRNITFNNTLPGYTTTATAAGTTTLTSSSTYHQRFTGSSAQTVVLPAATTMAQGQGFVIDNDSSGTLALQDGSTASLGSVTPGMAAYVFCENNSTTAGSWSGYMFVPGGGPSGQVTWGTSGLNMGGQALTNVTTIGATTSTNLNLQSNGTTNAILDTNGNLTNNIGNFVQGTTAKGINFTANTPASGMTSQLLNWYEEGTWTLADNSGAGLSLTITYATYTRVGRQVTINAFLTYPSTGNVGNAALTGLPFNCAANNYPPLTIDSNSGVALSSFVNAASKNISIGIASNYGTTVTNASLSSKSILISGTYFV